jgi:2'-5' RNA ligase
MRYGIELHFDRGTEKRLSAFYLRLKNAGIGSTMLASNLRPHITLSFFDSSKPGDVIRVLRALAERTRPFNLRFGNIGIFSDAGVVFLAPVPTLELLQIHRRCERGINRHVRHIGHYYRFGELVFHSTLATGLSERKVLQVVKLTKGAGLPSAARVVEIALVGYEYEPILKATPLFRAKLG